MIRLVVTMVIKEGKMDAFLAECKKIRPQVLAEKGCIMYDYHREIQSPLGSQEPVQKNRITLLEAWESLDALQEHSAAPHMKEFLARVKDMRESVTARVLEPAF
jgi:quinol monooxygenase YgiN